MRTVNEAEMGYPKIEKWGQDESGRPFYRIRFTKYNCRNMDEDELIRLFEEIDEALPPNTIERTVSERITALERTIGECPCHTH